MVQGGVSLQASDGAWIAGGAMQAANHAGVPAANTAFAEAQKIIDTLEQDA
ncbi:hypothetical protein [Sphingomonas sp. MMO-176]|uniref:hypothetical protein n=1 Tax=Sphingomonas sp. MMO-176 TaxID=3081299 RepID=UPI0013006F67